VHLVAVLSPHQLVLAHSLVLPQHSDTLKFESDKDFAIGVTHRSQRCDVVVGGETSIPVQIGYGDVRTQHLTLLCGTGNTKRHVSIFVDLSRQLDGDLGAENLPRHLEVLVELEAVGEVVLVGLQEFLIRRYRRSRTYKDFDQRRRHV
jgi:hypothetical protein